MTGVAYSYCSYCGAAYPPPTGWPRLCATCGQQVWRNPLPVAVAVQPVLTADGLGVVVVRRDIEPARGLLALPGGFIEYGEEWQDALVRELREETGLPAEATAATLITVRSAPAGGTMLIFGELPVRRAEELPPSAPTAEATEWLVLTEPTELAFSTHSEVLADFLARRSG
ncbi:NUDIX domain-containing protein [Micromonospora andamanensis]|uniref:NUDIX domain-containing protein n=1 Tax=Micromonospora andamanensis TaxID=1287068 RepID=UPI00194DCE02|nr:NUDIX domain-containing protein [Micromonospora andamanensis]GIJ41324.1 NUDIX hydrolase [Micromonospora andamanensis]